jgi:hypothetical protein
MSTPGLGLAHLLITDPVAPADVQQGFALPNLDGLDLADDIDVGGRQRIDRGGAQPRQSQSQQGEVSDGGSNADH